MSVQADARGAPRHKTLKGGKIVLNNNQSVIDCIVRNQSATGARLKLATVIGIPEEFELQVMDSVPRGCRVVWRSAHELGVAFR